MKLLFDTNVVLDIALKREPFVKFSTQALVLATEKNFQVFVTANSVTDIYYISRKIVGKQTTIDFLKDFLEIVYVAGIDKDVIIKSLSSDFPDFEDAVQVNAAINSGIDFILTRNVADFVPSSLPVYTPEEFVKKIGSEGE